MKRPSYLKKYSFDWELFEVVIGGKSALDSHSFLGSVDGEDQVRDFLRNYGFDHKNPILQAELFGIFQEAIQFIKKYFLKENNPDGLDFKVPNSLFMITDVTDLFSLATGNQKDQSFEDCLWAGIILKVMHTILHADKDLRSNYFPTIQQQVFDRFYKFIVRDENENLFLKSKDDFVPLALFDTKAKKSRDSVIIKLLHKAENVAEQLFDRIGVRFITETKIDTLRVVKFLSDHHLIIPHNIKPSRSHNSLIDLKSFKKKYKSLIKDSIRSLQDESDFLASVEAAAIESSPLSDLDKNNLHTSKHYRSIQFTCRQLIIYKNPFYQNFRLLRQEAKAVAEENEIAQKLLDLDTSSISGDIRFFYPYEVQILDMESHKMNTEGEASHVDYKKSQLKTAMTRLFKPLLTYKGLD